jgi:hypothetical protein
VVSCKYGDEPAGSGATELSSQSVNLSISQLVLLHVCVGMWFQRDSAPPHFALRLRNWLDNNLPDRWIAPGGSIDCPPRSPNLTTPPLDIYSWGCLKDDVYAMVVRGRDDVINRTEVVVADIPRQLLVCQGRNLTWQ